VQDPGNAHVAVGGILRRAGCQEFDWYISTIALMTQHEVPPTARLMPLALHASTHAIGRSTTR